MSGVLVFADSVVPRNGIAVVGGVTAVCLGRYAARTIMIAFTGLGKVFGTE